MEQRRLVPGWWTRWLQQLCRPGSLSKKRVRLHPEELEDRSTPSSAPSIASVSAVQEGSSSLTVTGSGFVQGATVQWNNQGLSTTFSSSTQLQAVLPASDVEEGTTASITVANPDGGASSATSVTVTDAPLTLTLQPLAPVEGVPLVNATLGTFTDADPNGNVNDYFAVISWGDGTYSTAAAATGTIAQSGSTFSVLGSHSYEPATNLGVNIRPYPLANLPPFSVTVYDLGPGDTPATTTQMTSGGKDGGAFQQGTHMLTNLLQVAHLSQRVAGGVYDPARAGPLSSVSFSYDFTTLSGPTPVDQVATGLLVQQGGSYFVADYQVVGSWTTLSGQGFTAANFVRLAGSGPTNPDFSAKGAPMQFGYFTANSTSGVLELFTYGADNFSVTLNNQTYADTTFNNADWASFWVQADNFGAAADSRTANVIVADAPLSVTLQPPSAPMAGVPLTNVPVATFTDADPSPTLANFQAVIRWGDGVVTTASAATGTITQNGSTFTVLGSHTYVTVGSNSPFSVQVFDLGPWNAPLKSGQVASGGADGGSYQQDTLTFDTLNVGDWLAHLSGLVGTYSVYNPAVSGPLNSVDFSLAFQEMAAASSTDQMGVALLLEQGGSYYMADYNVIGLGGWQTLSARGLTAPSFTLVSGNGPATPNFSATGAPMQFGYLAAHTCDGLQTFTYGADDFMVALNGVQYADATFNNADWSSFWLQADDLGAATDSKSAAITVQNPLPPVASSVSPVQEGTSTLTITGSGFVPATTVQWNGTSLATTYLSSTQLQAALPYALVAEEGTATLVVANPGGAAPAQTITIADAPVTVTLQPPAPLVGVALVNVPVATFTDADPGGVVSDYYAVIRWGDGVVTTASAALGTITQNGSTFTVLGSHTYLTAASLTFSVQVFDLGPSDTPAAASQMSSGGKDGGAYQRGQQTLTSLVQVAHMTDLVGSGGVYNPATAGPLTSLSYSFDFATLAAPWAGAQVAVGLLLEQGGSYYVTGYTGVGQSWTTLSGNGLSAANFTPVSGSGPSTPNFSASGAPMQFGYYTANSGSPRTMTYGIDNFKVTLNGTPYSDTTFNNVDWATFWLRADSLGYATDSKSAPITVQIPPPPVVSSVSPVQEGTSTLTITGSGFVPATTVQWNGTSLATTYLSSTQLQAALPYALVAEEGTATLVVANLGGAAPAQTVTIADAPLTLTLQPPAPTVGVALVNVPVATFTDADPGGVVSDYYAVIRWGDGVVTTASAALGTITQNGSTFTVLGSHTYLTAASLTFSVQVFDLGPSDTPAVASQMSSGGKDGGAYQRGQQTLTSLVQVAHMTDLVGSGGVYNPATAGPLTSLSYSFDFATLVAPWAGAQVAVGLLLEQGGSYYVAGYTGVGATWTTRAGNGLRATNFTLISGNGPSTPNFSASGAPMQFGYYTANSGTPRTMTYGIDNFNVKLNGTTYSDTTFNNVDWATFWLQADNLGYTSDSKSAPMNVK